MLVIGTLQRLQTRSHGLRENEGGQRGGSSALGPADEQSELKAAYSIHQRLTKHFVI